MSNVALPFIFSNQKMNVSENVRYYYTSLLSKALQMFKWRGFPDTVDIDYLDISLLTEGTACVIEKDNKLYCLRGNRGGKPDEYYKDTLYTVANPVLGSNNYKIGVNCVVCFNTSLDKWVHTKGIHTLILNTAQLLADNDISLSVIQKNARLSPIITAETESVKKTIDIVLNNMYQGKEYNCVDTKLIDEIKVNYLSNSNVSNDSITKLIELRQYVMANFYHSLGVNSNYNMKRERLLSSELEINNDCLKVNISNMLECREVFCTQLNEKYGLNCSVELGEVWKENYAEFTNDSGADVKTESND